MCVEQWPVHTVADLPEYCSCSQIGVVAARLTTEGLGSILLLSGSFCVLEVYSYRQSLLAFLKWMGKICWCVRSVSSLTGTPFPRVSRANKHFCFLEMVGNSSTS
jgi:hypothetical protein